MSHPGYFITFEGIEGSGKSTQARMLYEALKLKHKNRKVIFTREPGGTYLADQIRKLLLVKLENQKVADTVELDWERESELLLYLVARIEHVKKFVAPELALGSIVICDRFIDSTIAYQAYARGFGEPLINNLHEMLLPRLMPNLTLLLDLDPSVGLSRANLRMSDIDIKEDRFEQLGLDFHNKVREGFLTIAKRNPERVTMFDATIELATLHEKIYQLVETNIT